MWNLPQDWAARLRPHLPAELEDSLSEFLTVERAEGDVFPPAELVFEALRRTPIESVRAVILGQDPYHNHGQAHGLAFSVASGMTHPPSLRNIFRELQDDVGVSVPKSGDLSAWADQGVLLLNTVLTVRAHAANSHRGRGWETFTEAVIREISQGPPTAFVLWGRPAQRRRSLIDSRHLVIESPHPSPLSARRGFFGSRPFSAINQFLNDSGRGQIDWSLT